MPAPDVNTNDQIMAWVMDTYSMHVGHTVDGRRHRQADRDGRIARPPRGDRPRRDDRDARSGEAPRPRHQGRHGRHAGLRQRRLGLGRSAVRDRARRSSPSPTGRGASTTRRGSTSRRCSTTRAAQDHRRVPRRRADRQRASCSRSTWTCSSRPRSRTRSRWRTRRAIRRKIVIEGANGPTTPGRAQASARARRLRHPRHPRQRRRRDRVVFRVGAGSPRLLLGRSTKSTSASKRRCAKRSPTCCRRR